MNSRSKRVAAGVSFVAWGLGTLLATARPAWHEGDSVGPEGATLDTAGSNVVVATSVQGVGTFEKTGEGTVMFAEFPSVAEVDVRQGAIKLASAQAEAYPKLFRRWTFNNTLVDEVAGQTATLKGTAALDADGKTLTVSNSGNKVNTNYALLGNQQPTLPSSGAATVEIWFRHNAYKKHSKLFVVGCATDDELLISMDGASEGTGMSASFGSKATGNVTAGTLGVAAIGTNYHLSMTVSAPDAEGTTTITYILTDVDSGARVSKATYAAANWSLADLKQTYTTLGCGTGWWNNLDAEITVDEVRVWEGALTGEQLVRNINAGADVLGSDYQPPESALFRRWTFDNTLVDEVAGQTAVLKGMASLDASAKSVTVNGNGQKKVNYIDLGGGVLPLSGEATVEIWFIRNQYRQHAKLFAVGASTTDDLIISLDGATETAGMAANICDGTSVWSPGVATIGQRYHVSLTVSKPNAAGATTVTYELSNAETGALINRKSVVKENWSLADLTQTTAALGWGSWWNNLDAEVTVEEFRVWRTALSPVQLAESVEKGPDQLIHLSLADKPVDGRLRHRWSFNGSLVDAVSGRMATLKGAAALDVDGKTLTVSNPGGKQSNANYVLLGNEQPTLPSSGAATVEIWFKHNAYERYSKLFMVGCGVDDELLISVDGEGEGSRMSASFGSKATGNVTAGTLGVAAIGTNYHLSMTVSAPDAEGTTTITYILTDVDSGARVSRVTYAAKNWSLADLTQTYTTLGCGTGWWNNLDAEITVDEVRVWNAALTDEELAASAKAGPDALLYTALSLAPGASADFTGREVSVGDFTGAGTVTGILTVAREAKVTETLTVAGDLTLSGPLTVSCGTPIACSGKLTLGEGFSLRVADFAGSVVIRADGGIVAPPGGLKVRGWTVTATDTTITLDKNGLIILLK